MTNLGPNPQGMEARVGSPWNGRNLFRVVLHSIPEQNIRRMCVKSPEQKHFEAPFQDYISKFVPIHFFTTLE